MAWNPTVPATNADLLSLPIRENFQALDATLYTPLTGVADGTLLYRAAGPVLAGENNLVYDTINNNLKLFGGGVGTSGQSVLALGPSTAPTTSPVDTVQVYTGDLFEIAASRSLIIRDESGAKNTIGGTGGSAVLLQESTDGVAMRLTAGGGFGYIGAYSGHTLQVVAGGQVRLSLTAAGNAEFFLAQTGASGVGVLALGSSTAPTTSPVDTVQLYTTDIFSIANSRSLVIRDESGAKNTIGGTGGTAVLLQESTDGVAMRLTAGGGFGYMGTYSGHALQLVGAGNIQMVFQTDRYTQLYCPALGAMRIILVGGIDSGGAGARLLYVTN